MTPERNRVSTRIKELFSKIIVANPNITDLNKHRQSQLVASILFAFILMEVFVALPLIVFSHTYATVWEYKELIFLVIATLFTFTLYYLNRFGLVFFVTYLGIIASAVIFILWTIFDNTLEGTYSLNYLVLPVLISSILLPFKACIAVYLVTALFLATGIPLLSNQATQKIINDIVLFHVIIGSVIVMVTYYRNMLEKERKNELLENENRYRDLVEMVFEGVLIHQEGKILEANSGFARMFGYTLEEANQLYLRDILLEESRDILKANYHKGITERTEVVGIRKDKSRFNIEVIAKYQKWQGMRVRLMALSDISNRKQAEKADKLAKQELELRVAERTTALAEANKQLVGEIERRQHIEEALKASEEHFRLLFENAPVAVYQTSDDGILLTANQALADMFGYKAVSELLGKQVTDFYLNPAERNIKMSILNTVGALHNVELELKDNHGKVITVLDNARLVKRLDGSTFYEGTLINITERKQAEQDILRALEREKELNELKYNFITMASHNFRTPLSVVLSSAELLEHYGQNWSEDKKRQHLANIQQAVNQLTELLDEFSRVSNDPQLSIK